MKKLLAVLLSLPMAFAFAQTPLAPSATVGFSIPPAPSMKPSSTPPAELSATFPNGIRISDFARTVLQDVLHSPYIFSSEFLESKDVVGFSTDKLKRADSERLLRDILQERGFGLDRRDGYFRVFKLKDAEMPDLREEFIYRPRHRDLGYLSSVIQPLFSADSFSYQRQVSGSTNSKAVSPTERRPVDDGSSVYSSVTRTDTDVFVFRGLARDITRLKTLLAELDVPVPKVLVRAIVLEVSNGKNDGFSVSTVANLLSDRLKLSLGGGDMLSNYMTFKAGSFDAVASAIATSSEVKVVNSPTVYVETGVTASLSVGKSVPTLGAIVTSGNNTQSQSVDYQQTGVILSITPTVREDSIGFSVHQEVSDALPTDTGVKSSPTLSKNSLDTKLSMKSGEWVVLGGLQSTKDSSVKNHVPFFDFLRLGDVKANTKNDIVILINLQAS